MLIMHNLDKLIDSNGNWRLVYVYNNYGNNTLMLMPNFQIDEHEAAKVTNLMDMGEGEFEDSYIIDQFIRDRSNTPFIIRAENFVDSINVLQDRLSNLINGTDFSLFNKEFDQFTKFLDVCYLAYQDGNLYNKYDVYYKGWNSFTQ